MTEQQLIKEVLEWLWKSPELDGAGLLIEEFEDGTVQLSSKYDVEVFLRGFATTVRKATLAEVRDIVDEVDPSTDRDTSDAYWGSVLRRRLEALETHE